MTHLDAADLPPLAELDPEQCYLSWTVEIATSREEQELREVFEFVEHLAEIAIRRIDSLPGTALRAQQSGQRWPASAASLHPCGSRGECCEPASPDTGRAAERVRRVRTAGESGPFACPPRRWTG